MELLLPVQLHGKVTAGTGNNYALEVTAPEQTKVTIVLTSAIKDQSANANALTAQTLEYTTGDFTAPKLVSATPGATDKLTDNHPTFKMTFDENVKLGAGGSLKIFKANSTTAALTIPITSAMISNKEVTVSYVYNATTGGLDKNADYYVLVDRRSNC